MYITLVCPKICSMQKNIHWVQLKLITVYDKRHLTFTICKAHTELLHFFLIVLLFCLWPVKYKIAMTGTVTVGFITGGNKASFCNLTALVVSFY